MHDERFERDYGFYRPVISDVVRAYLKCGDLKDGFGVSLRSLTCKSPLPGLSL